MLKLSLTERSWIIFSTTWLWKISMWPLYYYHILAAGKFRSIDSSKILKGTIKMPLMRDNVTESGSKIWRVSRCRSTVSNKTIPATKQGFSLTKVSPVQSITDIILLGFWLILLPWMFILSYTTIYFLVNIFFSNVYISVNTIFECSYLFFGGEIGHPFNMYATGGMKGGQQKCVQVRIRGEGYQVLFVRTHLHYHFSCFCLIVSCFICRNLT